MEYNCQRLLCISRFVNNVTLLIFLNYKLLKVIIDLFHFCYYPLCWFELYDATFGFLYCFQVFKSEPAQGIKVKDFDNIARP